MKEIFDHNHRENNYLVVRQKEGLVLKKSTKADFVKQSFQYR